MGRRDWVVVTCPGECNEAIWAEYSTFAQAVRALRFAQAGADVMKRLPNGFFTTEF